MKSTLAASLGDCLGVVTAAVAAMPAGAAGEGTVALTWGTGAVYKHVASDYSKRTRMKGSQHL